MPLSSLLWQWDVLDVPEHEMTFVRIMKPHLDWGDENSPL